MTLPSEAARRYGRSAGLALLAYLILGGVLAAAPFWAPHWPRWLLTLAALAPAAPVLAAVHATNRYFAEEHDALQRAIQIEALLWAVGVTFGVATVWGFLEAFIGAPHVPSYFAFAVFSSVVASVQLARRLIPKAQVGDGRSNP